MWAAERDSDTSDKTMKTNRNREDRRKSEGQRGRYDSRKEKCNHT